jgi:hypothetical protein
MTYLEHKAIAASNLAAILTILKYDGDIPHDEDGTERGRTSNNIITKIGSTDAGDMYFISICKPHADCEAYVWCDNKGMCSYFDFSYNNTVINNEVVCYIRPETYGKLIEKLVADFNFESGKVTAEGIAKFLELLATMKDVI